MLLISIALVTAFYFNINLWWFNFREKQLIAYVAMGVVISWLFSLSVLRYVFRIRSLRFIICYPSPTFVIVVVMGLSWWLIPATLIEKRLLTESYAVFGAAILLRETLYGVKRMLSTRPATNSVAIGLPLNLVWLGSESPVTKLEDDRFQHKGLVLRLADLVEKNECRSFGLTGPHGSGKSSVLRMVKTVLDKRANGPFFVFFEKWGGLKEDLTKNILDSILETLSGAGVEIVSLLSWPSDYVRNVIGESSAWSRFVGCCLREQQTSKSILARLDPVLSAIDRRIVVVIEDVDRGSSDCGMNMLCQLLSDFTAVKNVSFFFLKSDETVSCIDFHRLCEHTEMIPHLNYETVVAELDGFVKTCESIAKDKLILCKDRNDIRQVVVKQHLGESLKGIDVFPDAICTLAHTPRALKHALRRGWLMWQNLVGEVDLLELALYVLLREGCPVGFQFLKSNLSVLRSLPKENVEDENKNGAIIDMRKRLAELGLEPEMLQVIKVVLTLFGIKFSLSKTESYYVSLLEGRFGSNFPDTLQGVVLKEPTDYFRRMEAGAVSEGETPDQDYLRAIWGYAQGQKTELPTKLATDVMWGEKLIQFKMLIHGSRSLNFVRDYIVACGQSHKGSARSESPGFEVVKEIMRGCDCSEELDYSTQLGEILVSALPYSLELAHAVYDRYMQTCDVAMRRSLRELWVKRFRELVESDAGYLASTVDPEYPYALYHTLRFRNEYPCFNKASDWQWLVPHLCAGMRNFSEQVTPDIVRLFVRDQREARGGRERLFDFDKAYFEEMCASVDTRAEMAALLLKYASEHTDNDPVAFGIRYVHKNVLEYIERVAVS